MAKRIVLVCSCRADRRIGRRAPQLDAGRAYTREDHKIIVADYREVAFQDVAVVRVVPASSLKRDVAAARALVTVAVVFRKLVTPAVTHLAAVDDHRFGGFSLVRLGHFLGRIDNDDLKLSFGGVDNDVLKCRATFLGLVANQVGKDSVIRSLTPVKAGLVRRIDGDPVGPRSQSDRKAPVRPRPAHQSLGTCLIGYGYKDAGDRLAVLIDGPARQSPAR